MATYIIRRLLLMIPTLIGITFLVFMLIALSPGGIGAALKSSGGQMEATSRAVQEAYLDDRYGLKDYYAVQYLRWLSRVSPVKFGVRDQIDPTGERVRPPKPLKAPPLREWFAESLPAESPEPATIDPAATPAQRVKLWRDADAAYAQARARLVAESARLEQSLTAYAREAGLAQAVKPDGTLRIDELRRAGPPNAASPAWPVVAEQAARALAAYDAANTERNRLLGLFAAKPLPESGLPIIPGVLSLDAPDFGRAFSTSRPVLGMVADALPVTLLVNLVAVPIIYAIAIPGGVLAAVRRGGLFDHASGLLMIALWSFPIPLAGVLSVGYLARNDQLGLFPASGLTASDADAMPFLPEIDWIAHGGPALLTRGYLLDVAWHIVLPVACLVYGGLALIAKQARAAMLDNMNADFVRTARAKGVPGRDVILYHVFRNSLLPLITIFVTVFPTMLSGSVVIEQIFTIPGMGKLVLDAIVQRDREVILATTLMIAAVNVFALLLADLLYALADPRISYK